MTYCDIHTHHAAADPEDVTIVNRIIGDKKEEISFSGQWYSVGIHPWYIYNNVQEQFLRLESVALHPFVVAIGEAGLDKLSATPWDIQSEVFAKQAALAERIGKPLIIHCVKAWDELIVQKKSIKPCVPWIVHGFRGNGVLAQQLIKQGFFLSFGENFNQQALQAAWPDYLFAETDDKTIDIRTVYRKMAFSLCIPLKEVATALEKNVQSVFFMNKVVPLPTFNINL